MYSVHGVKNFTKPVHHKIIKDIPNFQVKSLILCLTTCTYMELYITKVFMSFFFISVSFNSNVIKNGLLQKY